MTVPTEIVLTAHCYNVSVTIKALENLVQSCASFSVTILASFEWNTQTYLTLGTRLISSRIVCRLYFAFLSVTLGSVQRRRKWDKSVIRATIKRGRLTSSKKYVVCVCRRQSKIVVNFLQIDFPVSTLHFRFIFVQKSRPSSHFTPLPPFLLLSKCCNLGKS